MIIDEKILMQAMNPNIVIGKFRRLYTVKNIPSGNLTNSVNGKRSVEIINQMYTAKVMPKIILVHRGM